MSEIKKSELTEYLRESIEASGLSYREIANRCGYKNDRAIRAMATGQIPVLIDQAKKIAAALACDPDRFTVLVLRTVLPDDVIEHIGRAILRYRLDLGAE